MNLEFLPKDPRAFLREELRRRKERRPHYSLRAFARDLDMSASSLCEFLSGRQGMSRERVIFIGKKIQLSDLQIYHFCDLVESEFARVEGDRKAALVRAGARTSNDKIRLDVDRFRFIADWYHLTLLELLDVDGIRLSAVEMAQALGISEEEVQEALDRLVQLELVDKMVTDQGIEFKPRSGATITGEQGANRAIQIAHQGFLEMQARFVEKKSIDERSSLSISLGIENAHWNDFREELNQAILDIASKYSSRNKAKDQVACLAFQLITLLPQQRLKLEES